MATTTTTTTTAGVSSSSPTPTNGGNNQTNLQNSSLLFGFLVTFLALFVAFMLFGLAWRHLTDRMRSARRSVIEEGRQRSIHERKPKLWDVWVVPSPFHWPGIQPLSASVLTNYSDSQRTNIPGLNPDPPSSPHTPSSPLIRLVKSIKARLNIIRPHPIKSFRAFMERRRRRRRRRRLGNNIELGATEADGHDLTPDMKEKLEREKKKLRLVYEKINKNGLEVAVIIAMPSPKAKSHPKEHLYRSTGNCGGSGSRSTPQGQDKSQEGATTALTVPLAKSPNNISESADTTSPSQLESDAGLHEYVLGLTQVKLNRPLPIM